MRIGPGSRAVPPAVAETARVIWPRATRIEVTRSPRPGPGQRDYALLPHAAGPRWLLPVDAPATAGALRGQETGVRRAASEALARSHRGGVARLLPVRRLRVTDGHDDCLVSVLSTAVAPGSAVAMRLGSWDHARSLVARVLDPAGRTLAFGKVGIDAHGRASVDAEWRNLTHVASAGLRHIVVSEPRGRHHWCGLDLLLVSPLVPSGAPSPPGSELPVEAMLELARLGGPRTAPLSHSAWWSSVQERLERVEDPGLRAELAACAAAWSTVGLGTRVPLGPWHGDWTAWNMAWDGPRVLLWDWEHFAPDVPVGFDLLHHLAQGLRVSVGTGATAEAQWRSQADQALTRHVRLGAGARDVLRAAYLLEVNLRFVLDRQGTAQAADRRRGWDLDLLRRETGLLSQPAGAARPG